MILPRIILADDRPLRADLRPLLESHANVVSTVSDGRSLLEITEQLKPNLVVIDIGMPLMNGLESARRLKRLMPSLKLIVVAMNEDPDFAREAIQLGASGYLLKSSGGAELIYAIRMALRGKIYVTPKIAREIQKRFIKKRSPKIAAKTLTHRQREVVQLLADGKSMKEVASILNVTPRTVAFHKYHIMKELGIKTTAGLIQFAIKSKILVI